MSSLNITTQAINLQFHNSQLINRGADVFHNVDVFTSIDVEGTTFDVMYQCGMWFTGNDYNRPSTTLAVSDHGTDDFIYKLDQLVESEVEAMSDEDLAEFAEECDAIKSTDDLLAVYAALNELNINAKKDFESYKLDNNLSDDADMYIVDESTGLATLKA
ncbi:MAG: hypothetical protein HRU38_10905 [Saccharospirillaceae bacterium]|nr:hypothetical protein [Saccharospirillaceae bacterium]